MFRVILLLYFTLLFFYEKAEKTMSGRTPKSRFLNKKSAKGATGPIYSTVLDQSKNNIIFIDFPNPSRCRKARFCEKNGSTAAPISAEICFQRLRKSSRPTILEASFE